MRSRRRQCGRRADGEGLALRAAAPPRPAPYARSISRACRSATLLSRSSEGGRETEAEFTLPVEIRNDIARLEIAGRALGRRGDAARQALAPALRRRRHRLDRRHRAAAARLDLLPRARARAVRRRAPRRTRLARPGGEPFHRAAPADVDPRRRGQCRRGARAAQRAGSKTAACWCASPARGSPPATTTSCR